MIIEAARDAEMFDIGAGESGGFLPPVVGSEIEIFGTNEIADAAALVDVGDAGPEAVEFFLELIGSRRAERRRAGMRSKMVLLAPATGE